MTGAGAAGLVEDVETGTEAAAAISSSGTETVMLSCGAGEGAGEGGAGAGAEVAVGSITGVSLVGASVVAPLDDVSAVLSAVLSVSAESAVPLVSEELESDCVVPVSVVPVSVVPVSVVPVSVVPSDVVPSDVVPSDVAVPSDVVVPSDVAGALLLVVPACESDEESVDVEDESVVASVVVPESDDAAGVALVPPPSSAAAGCAKAIARDTRTTRNTATLASVTRGDPS